MTFSDSTVVQRSSGHFRVEHDGTTIIMSLAAGKYFTFDSIGFEVWEEIASPTDVSSLCGRLAEKHKARLETVKADVLGFLNKLKSQDLLVIT